MSTRGDPTQGTQTAGFAGQSGSNTARLVEIPAIKTSSAFPLETLEHDEPRAHALLGGATKGMPQRLLATLDAISRRWIAKACPDILPEIDVIAERLGRPGAYFLSVNYEWGCTAAVRHAGTDGLPELVRVLDWRTPGLGRHVMAANVSAQAGPFTTLTWPGYTGVLQASATGRFAASLNQAPMARRGGGLYPLDWFANRVRLWRQRGPTPAHLLRHVFETAPDYAAARTILAEHPISSPCIYAIAGCRRGDLCIIERTEDDAHVFDGPGVAANAWRAPGWQGRPRGADNAERICQLSRVPDVDVARAAPFDWIKPPVLNPMTRLYFRASPAAGHLVAQGIEAMSPATRPLRQGHEAVSASGKTPDRALATT